MSGLGLLTAFVLICALSDISAKVAVIVQAGRILGRQGRKGISCRLKALNISLHQELLLIAYSGILTFTLTS